MMTGLHHQIKQKATFGAIKLEELAPNSRQIAERMIANGELIKVGNVYKLNEMVVK